ncbi:MAG: hypothetical protein GY854_31070 [Deltaproteobacteria bacterium]|nr:hypothetical protein [Deltaproteobacteria bacterium]
MLHHDFKAKIILADLVLTETHHYLGQQFAALRLKHMESFLLQQVDLPGELLRA